MPSMRKDVDYKSKYDPENIQSLLEYALKMGGHTIGEICLEEDIRACDIKNDKGKIGQIVEYGYFFLDRNSSKDPDLGKGIELKTTALRRNQNGTVYPKERLSITQISFKKIYEGQEFEEAFHGKLDRMLIVFLIYNEEEKELGKQYIDSVKLWSVPKEDMPVIMEDWSIISNLIRQGRANELSCRLTTYLEASPKGKDSRHTETYGDGLVAKRRGFAFKPCYVNKIYNSDGSSAHIPGDFRNGFDKTVLGRFAPFEGMADTAIESQLGINAGQSKQRYAILARYMVCGKNTKSVEELEKAGILMKTVRMRDGRPAEPMTFPAFDYFEVGEEDWEDSEFHMMLDRKILLVIFDLDDAGTVTFRRAALWMVPEEDIDIIKETWIDTKEHILDGSYLFITEQKKAKIAFVKPHSTKTEKPILCPDGQYRKKVCFSLKQDYIAEQVSKMRICPGLINYKYSIQRGPIASISFFSFQ